MGEGNEVPKRKMMPLRMPFYTMIKEMYIGIKSRILDRRSNDPMDVRDKSMITHLMMKHDIRVPLEVYRHLEHFNEFLILKEYDEYTRFEDVFREIKDRYGENISRIFTFYPLRFFEDGDIFNIYVLHINTGSKKWIRVIKSEKRVIEKDLYFLEDSIDREILRSMSLEFAEMPEDAKNFFKRIGVWLCLGEDGKQVRCSYDEIGELDEKSKNVISKWYMFRIVFDFEGDIKLAKDIIDNALTQAEAHIVGIKMEMYKGKNIEGAKRNEKERDEKKNEGIDIGDDFEI